MLKVKVIYTSYFIYHIRKLTSPTGLKKIDNNRTRNMLTKRMEVMELNPVGLRLKRWKKFYISYRKNHQNLKFSVITY